jgi:hypothetical protein
VWLHGHITPATAAVAPQPLLLMQIRVPELTACVHAARTLPGFTAAHCTVACFRLHIVEGCTALCLAWVKGLTPRGRVP